MSIEDRIEVLAQTGDWLRTAQARGEMEPVIRQAQQLNPWFTPVSIETAMQAIVDQYLDPDKLSDFITGYPEISNTTPKRVGVITAGNIPLVGFHDLLCIYLAGHLAKVKLSDKDSVLISFIFNKLQDISQEKVPRYQWCERLSNFEAVIATGSDSSAMYFEKYFGDYPRIIRRNRHGIAVLNGEESPQELRLLGRDIFQYFGLGCRSVSKLYVPVGYDFVPLLEMLNEYESVLMHSKYKNNFDYNLATYVINRIEFLSNKCILLKEDPSLSSRIGTLYYSYYENDQMLKEAIRSIESRIQCVVSSSENLLSNAVPFGASQQPRLDQFADDVDTLQFLLAL